MARTAARASDWARVGSSKVVVEGVWRVVVVVVLVAEVEVGGVIVVGAEDVDAEADVDAILYSSSLCSMFRVERYSCGLYELMRIKIQERFPCCCRCGNCDSLRYFVEVQRSL